MSVIIAAALGLAFSPTTPQSRVGIVRMQSGPGFKGGGQFEGVQGGQYSSAGMNTRRKPMESMAPEVVDMEAAAASQQGIRDVKPEESIAGGFGKQVVPMVSNLRVGDGKLAGDLGFDPLQLASDSKTLAWYREAEIKHSRLAMLAALGVSALCEHTELADARVVTACP